MATTYAETAAAMTCWFRVWATPVRGDNEDLYDALAVFGGSKGMAGYVDSVFKDQYWIKRDTYGMGDEGLRVPKGAIPNAAQVNELVMQYREGVDARLKRDWQQAHTDLIQQLTGVGYLYANSRLSAPALGSMVSDIVVGTALLTSFHVEELHAFQRDLQTFGSTGGLNGKKAMADANRIIRMLSR